MRQVAEAIAPGIPVEIGGGAAAIDRDEVLLDQILRATSRARLVRLWVNDPCLVTTRRFSRRAEFVPACAISEAYGWPVHVRSSGGTTVVHRNGILNVSLLTRSPTGSADANLAFAPLIDILSGALEILGLSVTTGHSTGSYCDGAHNLLANGSKIAGTACLIRRSAETPAQLTHAAIWIEGDVAEDVAAVARFESALGLIPEYVASAHTTVELSLAYPNKSTRVSRSD